MESDAVTTANPTAQWRRGAAASPVGGFTNCLAERQHGDLPHRTLYVR